ncbi:hypothetical protein YC2023_062516 [Brassica napus]
MVPVDSGVVVIPACSGEFCGHFLSSPVVTSRFRSRSVTVCCSGDACLSLFLLYEINLCKNSKKNYGINHCVQSNRQSGIDAHKPPADKLSYLGNARA